MEYSIPVAALEELSKEHEALVQQMLVLYTKMEAIVEPVYKDTTSTEFDKFSLHIPDCIVRLDYHCKNQRRADNGN